jgi:hypothetical protein
MTAIVPSPASSRRHEGGSLSPREVQVRLARLGMQTDLRDAAEIAAIVTAASQPHDGAQTDVGALGDVVDVELEAAR